MMIPLQNGNCSTFQSLLRAASFDEPMSINDEDEKKRLRRSIDDVEEAMSKDDEKTPLLSSEDLVVEDRERVPAEKGHESVCNFLPSTKCERILVAVVFLVLVLSSLALIGLFIWQEVASGGSFPPKWYQNCSFGVVSPSLDCFAVLTARESYVVFASVFFFAFGFLPVSFLILSSLNVFECLLPRR